MAAFQSHTSELRETRFSCQHHATKLLKSLNETRKNPDLCDAYVAIDDQKICVQKSVLSAASQYLRALFTYDGKLSEHEGKTVINLNMSEDTFHTILDFIYTCCITLTEDNIQDVLQAADLLLLADLKDTCCKFLEECVSPNNCIGIRDLTAQLSCHWVHLKVTQYLDEHIREVLYSEEFLRMPAEGVVELLSRDTLQVRHEDDVLEALVRWARLDPDTRRASLKGMIQGCVRVSRLSADIPHQGEWQEEVGAALAARMAEREREGEGEEDPRGRQTVLVVCGGEGLVSRSSEEVTVKDVTRFFPLKGRESTGGWLNMAPMLSPRFGHGLVEVGGYLYAVGGRDHQCRILNTVERYDASTNTWTLLAPMNHARFGFGLVAVDDRIYAMGGSNDMTDPLVSMEVYDVFTDTWRSLPDMILKRVWSAFAVADKKIYVIAGGIVGKFYEAVECFDTRTDTWSSVSPMRERRCDARAVAVGSDIYVFGGFRRLECPSAVHSGHSLKFCGMEMYASANDYWTSLPSRFGAPGLCTMSENCALYGALYDGEDVLVVGALEVGQGAVHTVRAFNRHSNTWHTMVQQQPERQERYQCCLLTLPISALTRLKRFNERVKAE